MRLAAAGAVLAAAASMAQAEVLECKPAYRFYCENIHIGCSGRSRVKTTPFRIDLAPERATLTDATGQVTALQVHPSPGAVVLRDPESGNWIRLLRDGTFAQRLQARNPALMSRGRCRQVPDATR